jgi:TolB protein
MSARVYSSAVIVLICACFISCSRKTGRGDISAKERAAMPGVIAFVSERGANKDVWLIRPTGEEARLSRGDEYEFPAGVTPDGRTLVVVATREIDGVHKEQVRLLPVDPANGASLALHAPRGRARNPSVSPDGSWLVAESDERGFSDIVRVDLSAPDAPLFLTSAPEGSFEPSISPDGERIAFVSSRDGDPEIYVMGARGHGADARRLTAFHKEDWGPSWSPDGQWIAFLSNREGRDRVFLVRPDGSNTQALSGSADTGDEREHAWSPDGQMLVFVGRRQDGETRIWMASVNQMTKPVALTDGKSRDDQPAFSPDGRYLVYVSEPRGGDTDLYLMRTDGSGKTRLTSARGADWLPRWFERR